MIKNKILSIYLILIQRMYGLKTIINQLLSHLHQIKRVNPQIFQLSLMHIFKEIKMFNLSEQKVISLFKIQLCSKLSNIFQCFLMNLNINLSIKEVNQLN